MTFSGKGITFCLIMILGLLFTTNTTAQECGDIDADTHIAVTDLLEQINHLYVLDEPPNCRADVDGYEGVTLHDVIYLTDYIYRLNVTLEDCCPTPHGPLVPITDPDTYLIQETDLFPAGETTVTMRLALSTSYNWASLGARYQCRVGTDIPTVTRGSYQFSSLASSTGPTLQAEFTDDEIMLVLGTYLDTGGVDAGTYSIVSLNISVPASTSDRPITLTAINTPHVPMLVTSGTNYLPVVGLSMTFPDSDGDHITDIYDNCPLTSNYSQIDLDLDSIGDACDPFVDTCALQLVGDLNGDLQIDNSDLTYFVQYLLNGGPPPAYLSNADVDGDCDIDTGDLRSFTDWLYGVGSIDLVECTCHPANIRTYCCLINRGNVNADPEDKCNIADVTYITEYLFGIPNGPVPLCWEEADVNADGEYKINISDVTYLVDFLFGIPEGSAPQPCPY